MSIPHIAILMATYNGARFLPEQLESIEGQSYPNWSLCVSDDGSGDETCDIIRRFTSKWPAGRVALFKGPSAGPTRNFMSLITRPDIPAGNVAFADQDDVWLPDRLERGMNALAPHKDTAALYGSRTIVADAALNRLGHAPLFRRPPKFANAIVQSIAGGNTMLLNTKAHELIRATSAKLDMVAHDWWAYQLISAAGGRVIYDPTPSVIYRQHEDNLIGSNAGYRAQLHRWRAVMNNRFSAWNDANVAALDACKDHITPDNLALLRAFQNVKQARGSKALGLLRQTGIYRQTRNGNRSLELAALLGKL